MNDFCQAIEDRGFAVVPNVLPETTLVRLREHIAAPGLRRSRAGIRHSLGVPAIAEFAKEDSLMSLARAVLGAGASPFRATLFDKSHLSNWLVVWHQDTALPFRERRDKIGWGPWSVKDGINYAHAPARALERVIALRVHLDDSLLDNGPLRVLPATHKLGVLTDDEIQEVAQTTAAVDGLILRGGILAMRPLIVHSSSKAAVDLPRRVLHIEYAGSRFIEDDMELAVA